MRTSIVARLMLLGTAGMMLLVIHNRRRNELPVRADALPLREVPVAWTAGAVEELAANEPMRALAAAAGAHDASQRTALRQAALRGWARVDPDQAVEWVLATPPDERLGAATAVLIGAIDDPETAVRVGNRLCAADPAFIREHGRTLITALGATDEFGTAVRFAELGGPERSEWMSVVFAQWLEHDSTAAVRAAEALGETDALAVNLTPR